MLSASQQGASALWGGAGRGLLVLLRVIPQATSFLECEAAPPPHPPAGFVASLVLQARGLCLPLPSAGRASRRPGGSWRPGSGTQGGLEPAPRSATWNCSSQGHHRKTGHRLSLVGSKAFGLEGTVSALEDQLEKRWAPTKKAPRQGRCPRAAGGSQVRQSRVLSSCTTYWLCGLRQVTLPLCASMPSSINGDSDIYPHLLTR